MARPSGGRPRRPGISRPPIGALWGRAQIVVARPATKALLTGGALVLSPHQDDETIGCGLLMAEKARRGERVTVAVATDGRGGWYSPEPRPTPDDIVRIRHLEWHRALDALGVPPADRFEFGFPDGALPQHEAELVDRILDILGIGSTFPGLRDQAGRSAPRSSEPGPCGRDRSAPGGRRRSRIVTTCLHLSGLSRRRSVAAGPAVPVTVRRHVRLLARSLMGLTTDGHCSSGPAASRRSRRGDRRLRQPAAAARR